jgi:UDP-GlcNAc:undecaprenyl-phosphate GlcNAc-1-phosphate transferase
MTLGFLPHNMFPARVFMGDTGSMLIGLMLAACAITLTGQTDPGALELTSVLPSFLLILLPLAVIAVPLFDLALAVMRRTRRGANIFTPDKEHLHHRLLERGHSHRRAVMLMHAGTALLAFATVSTAFIPFLYSLSALIAGLASLVYFGRRRDPKKVVVA